MELHDCYTGKELPLRRDHQGRSERATVPRPLPAAYSPMDEFSGVRAQALAHHQRLPAVVPRAVVAELLAGLADAYLFSPSKQLQTMPVQQIIISHGGLLLWTSSTQRMGRRFTSGKTPGVYRSCEPFILRREKRRGAGRATPGPQS